MKILKISIIALLCGAFLIGETGCNSMTNTGKGALIGGGGGAGLGAGLGALIGGGKGAGIGAAIGAAVGAGAGTLIGNKMDRQKKELEQQLANQAKVEQTTDQNGLAAIKVTFDGGILFPTNGTALNASAKAALDKFAISLLQNPDTDVTVFGHTDSTGTLAVNERISLERAQAVRNYLETKGIASNRFLKVEGKAYTEPVASNDTAEGRAANRRVEVYISAGQAMIRQAQEGALP